MAHTVRGDLPRKVGGTRSSDPTALRPDRSEASASRPDDRLVSSWFRKNPPPAGARSAEMRKLLGSHRYIRDLHSPGDPDERIERFTSRSADEEDIPLRVVEVIRNEDDALQCIRQIRTPCDNSARWIVLKTAAKASYPRSRQKIGGPYE